MALRGSLDQSYHSVEEATEAFSHQHMIDLYTEPEQIIYKWIC